MKRYRNGTKRRPQTIRAWTYDQARKALPYFTAVMSSLREHQLEAQARDRQVHLLAQRPGRPDRTAILAQANAAQEARMAERRAHESLEELYAIDVFCLDPIRGEAIIPFVHDNQLAWFLYDLFDDEPIRCWRYHTDPLDARRPLAEALTNPNATTWTV